MKILLLGAGGFIGSAVYEQLNSDHEVYAASREKLNYDLSVNIDLNQEDSIKNALIQIKPEVIISCAGIVENSEVAVKNILFTKNLLGAIIKSAIKVDKIVISGSAAEYGFVKDDTVPINEASPIEPTSFYGKSKADEIKYALEIADNHRLPVVVARIFNPIGLGMHDRFLIPNILKQIKKVKTGELDTISVSRLDSKRDYINVKDIAGAIKALVENDKSDGIYNIGSGKSTTNAKLIELIIQNCGLASSPSILETVNEPEKPVASIADITKITRDTGWTPSMTIEETVEEIVHAERI